MSHIAEHDFEPLAGLPGELPRGEVVLWQGRPDWRGLARYAFHVRKLSGYFAVLLALRGWQLAPEGATVMLQGLAMAGALALVALGLLLLGARLIAGSTCYTLTNHRLVIRSGVALPISVNLPFSRAVAAALKERPDGSGDLALRMADGTRPSWVVLWPHVRPWHWFSVQPALRAIPDARRVARLLTGALRREAGEPAGETRIDPLPLTPSMGGSAH